MPFIICENLTNERPFAFLMLFAWNCDLNDEITQIIVIIRKLDIKIAVC